MGKLTLEDLRKLRDEKKKELSKRDVTGKTIQIIVGMGTCGIAAGAKETFDAFVDALDRRGITDAVVKQTGCMGLCYVEPTVEVIVPGMPDVVYGKVTKDRVCEIIEKHILEKKLVNNLIYDKPAADIVKE